jgi:hypothetical protein
LIAALLKRNLRVLVVSHTNVATDHAIRGVAELLESSEDYQSGKLVRYGNISPSVPLPDMVIQEKIAEKLGREFREHLSNLRAHEIDIQGQLMVLRNAEALAIQQMELRKKLQTLRANLQQLEQVHWETKRRALDLAEQLSNARVKLREAQVAGRFKRLLRGLNPLKLDAQIAQIETELATTQRAVSADSSKIADFKSTITNHDIRETDLRKEAIDLLGRLQLGPHQIDPRIKYLEGQLDQLARTIRKLEEELGAIAAKILREAKLIATSLTKATIARQMDAQKFDVIVVDEASMVPMPALYIATNRATQKVIVVGDFRQLPPICISDDEAAKKWLERDIFNQAGVQKAVDEGRSDPRMTMLQKQYRMHPNISAISNEIFYRGKLRDSLDRGAIHSIATTLERSPFGENPLVVCDVSAVNPWSSKLDQGGRYNLYSAVLSAELAKQAVTSGLDSIGVIAPYAVHSRLIRMILDESSDPKVRHLKASTAHRFQGLEQDAIIFDIAEGPMPRFGPSLLVDGSDLASQAAKLINVSVTRPKAQLVVVANLEYLDSKLRRDSVLRYVLKHLRLHATLVESQEVLKGYICEDFDRWKRILDPRSDGIDPTAGNIYTERNFYAAFFTDLRKAQREVIIVSPFLTASRVQHFLGLFRTKVSAGVRIRVFTRTIQEQRCEMLRQAEMVLQGLKQLGAEVVERRGLHQNFAFVDRQVAWEGSLNIFSQSEGRITDHMRRLSFPKTCEELIALHELGSDAEVEPGARHRIQTERRCDVHGAPMVLVPGPHGFFLGCPRYPNCEVRYSIARGESVVTEVRCTFTNGRACSQAMSATRGRYGVYLRCSDPSCPGKRSIRR